MSNTGNATTVKLLEDLDRLTNAALAPSTRSTYRRAWVHFNNFSTEILGHCLSPPITVSVMSLFIAYLFQKSLAPKTISTYLSAIGYVHKILAYNDPTQSFLVQKLVEGSYRLSPSIDARLPITVHILDKLIGCIPLIITSTYEQKLFTAVFLFAFSAFARVGELVWTNNAVSDHILCLSDLSFSCVNGKIQKVLVCFRKYKHSNGQQSKIVSVSHGKTSVSAITALVQFIDKRKTNAGPLFCYSNGTCLTRTHFDNILRRCLKMIGLDSSKYKGHSFRIGAATAAAENGLSDAQIRSLGRWNSNAFQKYIRSNYAVCSS